MLDSLTAENMTQTHQLKTPLPESRAGEMPIITEGGKCKNKMKRANFGLTVMTGLSQIDYLATQGYNASAEERHS